MAKPNMKGKGPQGPKKPKGRKSLDENALSQLTSKIDQSLKSGNDRKRKKPPTSESANQDRKRQLNSGSGSPKPNGKGELDALLEEIKALGGDERDLELIQDIDSDDEDLVKGTKQPMDKRLKDELVALSKELGFADYQPSEASDDDQDDGAHEDAEEEDVDDDEDEDVNDEDEGQDEEEGNEDEAPRKIGDMVSTPHAFTTPLTTN